MTNWNNMRPQLPSAESLAEPLDGASFSEAARRFFLKYFVFSGRASKSEYWYGLLLAGGITFFLFMLQSVFGQNTASGFGKLVTTVSNIWILATFIPMLSLSVRRLHDANLSGWVMMALAVPVVGVLTVVVVGLLPPNPMGVHYDKVGLPPQPQPPDQQLYGGSPYETLEAHDPYEPPTQFSPPPPPPSSATPTYRAPRPAQETLQDPFSQPEGTPVSYEAETVSSSPTGPHIIALDETIPDLEDLYLPQAGPEDTLLTMAFIEPKPKLKAGRGPTFAMVADATAEPAGAQPFVPDLTGLPSLPTEKRPERLVTETFDPFSEKLSAAPAIPAPPAPATVPTPAPAPTRSESAVPPPPSPGEVAKPRETKGPVDKAAGVSVQGTKPFGPGNPDTFRRDVSRNP